jgi:hypothetical protein
VLLLGVEDVKETKRFYVDRGLAVGKCFGGKYVPFDTPSSPVKLALYARRALAKDAAAVPDRAAAPDSAAAPAVVGNVRRRMAPPSDGVRPRLRAPASARPRPTG